MFILTIECKCIGHSVCSYADNGMNDDKIRQISLPKLLRRHYIRKGCIVASWHTTPCHCRSHSMPLPLHATHLRSLWLAFVEIGRWKMWKWRRGRPRVVPCEFLWDVSFAAACLGQRYIEGDTCMHM